MKVRGKNSVPLGEDPRSQILVQLKDLVHDESCTAMDYGEKEKKLVLSSSLRIPDPSLLGDP